MATRCFDLDGIRRYDEIATTYARGRPSYPRGAIDMLTAGLRESAFVVDAGAGTAISARLLADRFARTTALDANLDMLNARAPHASMNVAVARAESLPVRSHSVDLLTAFNAFHWFQPAEFLTEAQRVLSPRGRLGLAWNDWDMSDPFTSEFVRLMRSCAGDFPPEDREREVAPLYESPRFTNVRRAAFPNVHTLDLPTLRLRLKSMSYVPREGPVWDELSIRLDEIFARYADVEGVVRHRYTTAVFVAEPVS